MLKDDLIQSLYNLSTLNFLVFIDFDEVIVISKQCLCVCRSAKTKMFVGVFNKHLMFITNRSLNS